MEDNRMAEELLSRKDVKKELTWDLTLIYKDEAALMADADRLEKLTGEIESLYKGKLGSAETVNKCLDEYREAVGIITLIGNYCELATSVDYYDTHNMELAGKMNRKLSECMSRLSFIDSELAVQDNAVIEEAVNSSEANANYLKDVLRGKPHLLNPETERVLTALSQTTGAPYEIYNTVKLADMKFPDFEVDGRKYPLGYSLFEDDYEYDERTDVRRTAFEAFSSKLCEYENVTAAAYNAAVQYEKTMADLRGFDNVFASLLFGQKVDESMYNRQIDLIMEKLAPHMRKYAKLIGRVHGLDKVTYADLKLPVDTEYSPKLTIEESKDYVTKGLSILGDDYVKMVETAYKERWFDFAQNKGKSTGGFCASPYGKNSFILLSWNGRMSDVFTIAHELGHAGHFKACNSAQSIFDTNVSTYFVESPSTMNELLLGHYLLKTSDDKRFRRWVLANMVGNTYYHNFVTHLLEAAYQREVYRKVQAGESVQAETLSGIMKNVLEKFWGDAVELTDGAELTWMRQPHYYMGLYSYTYSAGLTIATQVCKRIEKEGQPAVDDWKKVLAAGSTKTPVELAAMAGIDISTDEPLLDTIETIGAMIDEICLLTDELERRISNPTASSV
jgi:oligoendopeptidase F